MSNFNTTGYIVIRNAINKEVADFLYQYFLLRRTNTDIMFKSKYISEFETYFGVWNDPQAPNTFSVYGDPAFDTLLPIIQPKIEEIGEFKLHSNYSYARLYKKGDVLMHPIFNHPYILLEKKEEHWLCCLVTSEETCPEILEACKSRFFADNFITRVLFTTVDPIGRFMYPYENPRQLNSVLKKLKELFV
jgi:hypothetical protein